MFTSRRALSSTWPVLLSITPLTFTDPPFDVAANDPPLMPLVVTSLPAVIAIDPDPETSAVPRAMLAAPFDAVMSMAPLFVTTALLTVTSRDADRVTAPPDAPPRPSI